MNFTIGKGARSKLTPWIELDEYGEVENRSDRHDDAVAMLHDGEDRRTGEGPQALRELEQFRVDSSIDFSDSTTL